MSFWLCPPVVCIPMASLWCVSVLDVENADIKTPLERLGGKSIGEALLAPTKIYVKPMLALFEASEGKGGFPYHRRRLL